MLVTWNALTEFLVERAGRLGLYILATGPVKLKMHHIMPPGTSKNDWPTPSGSRTYRVGQLNLRWTLAG